MSQALSVFAIAYQPNSIEAFKCIKHLPYPVMLESGHGKYADLMGRFDILTANPAEIIASTPDQKNPGLSGNALLQKLNDALDALNLDPVPEELPFIGGAIGFMNYDFGQQLETLPCSTEQDISLPAAWFGIFGWALITDHKENKSWIVNDETLSNYSDSELLHLFNTQANIELEAFSLTAPFASNLTQNEYSERFRRLKEYIYAGDCYQVNFAQRFSAECKGDSLLAFEKIANKIPTPFFAYFQLGQWDVLSHSPERFVELENNQVTTKPIKGTRPRGHNPANDQALSEELLNSTKDRAENLMIVDLLRNDLSRVCAPFSVKVPKLFDIESYPNVHHLVSTVTGTLDQNETATSLLGHSFPGGSITGAPKIRAMEIIDELEPHHRSIYCGSVIYISRHGRMDSSITIRTLVRDGNKIHAWGGGGIVADSEAESEYQETLTKISPLLKAIS